MRIRKVTLYILCLTLGFLSCKKDNNTVEVTPPRDRGEQQIIDNDSIVGYLETHYYNSSDFVSNPDPSIDDLVITELSDGQTVPDGSTLLMDAVEKKSVVYAETDYDFYILKLNQGGGDSPTFSDKVRVNYEGRLLDETIFDSATTPVSFDLLSLVPGWSKVLPDFNTAESFVDAGDGTVNFINNGVGVMFLPSGLAYFSSPTTIIPAYSPLMFRIELFQMYQNDNDGDGIPSYLEDLNGDGEFTLDDDTDGDNIPNYADNNDDGDGVLTKDEIVVTTYNKPTLEEVKTMTLESDQVLLNKIVKEQDGTYTGTVITFTDTDGDGTPDYLDPTN
ncbi:FKBP-type peptidyl-prolyl cis-trans isomerase [Yeosuana marina]|uniref:FKBP-type peptidyl-prolyl cis-trans isomerase n=1 Tax=Yeosuana marina TaxID=1565536 RepID=UPI0030C7AE63